jgi:hypothetical protein
MPEPLERITEIRIVRREAEEDEKWEGEPTGRMKPHFYLYYEPGNEDGGPKEILKSPPTNRENWTSTDGVQQKKLDVVLESGNNYVSREVNRRQRLVWICRYPFTIYFGGTSIITTDPNGWPRPRKIIPYLKGEKWDFKNKEPREDWYTTEPVFVVNNALSGTYKYFVSVYIPRAVDEEGNIIEGDIICVDDPEDVIPPPRGG